MVDYNEPRPTKKERKEIMTLDINNLPKELKEGKIIGGGTRAILVTPLARANFVCLTKEEEYLGTPTGKNCIILLFESDTNAYAGVNLQANFLPFFQNTLDAYGIKASVVDGAMMAGTQTLFRKGEKFSKEGRAYAGYNPSTVYLKTNHKIRQEGDKVPCYNAAGDALDLNAIYSGCFVRCKLGLYKPEKFPNLSIILKSVQFIFDGEPIGGDGLAPMDAIEGADAPPAPSAGESDFSSFL